MPEQRTPIGWLKTKLNEYLSRARAGQLARAGLARKPRKVLDLEALAADRPRDPEGRSLEAVLEERAEGW